jgi:hypothetical protein
VERKASVYERGAATCGDAAPNIMQRATCSGKNGHTLLAALRRARRAGPHT